MSDTDEDPSAFFARLKKQLGIDFETDGEDPQEEARAVASASQEPDPAPIVDVEEVEPETYPGSEQPLQADLDVPEDGETPEYTVRGWADSPRVYHVDGRATEFFTIGAVARALKREVVTLRKWEQKGYLPKPRYRSPGKGIKQDRLYTREQVEGLLRIAREENLLDPKKKMRINQTNFPARARALFKNRSTDG